MRYLIAMLLALTARPANAQDIGQPPEVREILDVARKSCAEAAESGKVAFGSGVVRRLDLNGDGRDDYIIDLHDAACDGAASLFCGTGGCDLTILVAQPAGGLATVFNNTVRSYEVLPGKGSRAIRFELHGSFCGGFGSQRCVKIHRITTTPFDYRKPG
jgi:hypothetical protein